MRRLGKYELESEIGHGGMATVFRARDTSLERAVAVKVLHPHLRKAAEARERFTREARSVARLRHPYIMEIFDFAGEEAEESYLVAELLTGPTLRELADGPPIPAEAAAAIVLPVAEALACAHAAGIVHRDVKPENVLLHEARTVKLTDFGIAQMVDAQSFTHTGQILGSPGHMAPEQIETGEVDARSDIFALGTVLFLLATGQLPFDGKNAHQVLKKVVECEHPDPLRLRPTIGRELAGIIGRAMAQTPGERFPSAEAFAGALREFLAQSGQRDPQALLEAFLANPAEEGPKLEQRVLAQLRERAAEAADRGDRAAAVGLYDRILALDENDEQALAAVQRLGRGGERWPRVAAAAAVVLVVSVVGATALGRRGPPEPPEVAQAPSPAPEPRAPSEAVTRAERRVEAPPERARTVPVAVVADPEPNRPVVRRAPLLRPGQPRVVQLRPRPQNVRISIDGGEPRPFGPGFTEVPLLPGRHVFRVTGECCLDLEREVMVSREAQPLVLPLPLDYRDARLFVRVSQAPAEANVAIKGPEGRLFLQGGRVNQILQVPVGRERFPRATVMVTAPGHRTYTRAVRLTSGGDTLRLVAELEPDAGRSDGPNATP